ncbi:MAG: hypothetical protein U0165_10755 [Polyangiaceae bacterium]
MSDSQHDPADGKPPWPVPAGDTSTKPNGDTGDSSAPSGVPARSESTPPAQGAEAPAKAARAPALAPGHPVAAGLPKKPILETIQDHFREYFLAEPPSFWVAMVPLLALSALLFTRHPQTSYIFDEQEALLANPYVNGKGDKILPWIDAFKRDFWGLPAERSVRSYRPIPDLIWRVLWHLSTSPWLHHWFNVLLHAANGACLVVFIHMLTKRRGLSWMAGAVFVGCAVLTEAVAGVVGIADVLGGLGALLALLALTLPLHTMPFAVFAAVLFGLYSKERAGVCAVGSLCGAIARAGDPS